MKTPVFKKVWIVDDARTGEVVRQERLKAGISLRTLASRVGWSPAYMSDLENGKRKWTQKKVDRVMMWMK